MAYRLTLLALLITLTGCSVTVVNVRDAQVSIPITLEAAHDAP